MPVSKHYHSGYVFNLSKNLSIASSLLDFVKFLLVNLFSIDAIRRCVINFVFVEELRRTLSYLENTLFCVWPFLLCFQTVICCNSKDLFKIMEVRYLHNDLISNPFKICSFQQNSFRLAYRYHNKNSLSTYN